MEFSLDKTDATAWVREGRHPELGPTFNLQPPSIGPRVEVVRTVVAEDADPLEEVTEGTIVATIGSVEPSARLLKPSASLYGTYVKARNADVNLRPD